MNSGSGDIIRTKKFQYASSVRAKSNGDLMISSLRNAGTVFCPHKTKNASDSASSVSSPSPSPGPSGIPNPDGGGYITTINGVQYYSQTGTAVNFDGSTFYVAYFDRQAMFEYGDENTGENIQYTLNYDPETNIISVSNSTGTVPTSDYLLQPEPIKNDEDDTPTILPTNAQDRWFLGEPERWGDRTLYIGGVKSQNEIVTMVQDAFNLLKATAGAPSVTVSIINGRLSLTLTETLDPNKVLGIYYGNAPNGSTNLGSTTTVFSPEAQAMGSYDPAGTGVSSRGLLFVAPLRDPIEIADPIDRITVSAAYVMRSL